MTWFLMNKEGHDRARDGKSFGKYKTKPEREMLQKSARTMKKPRQSQRTTSWNCVSFNLTMPFLPYKPLKKGDPTLDALSVPFRLNPENKIIHHCDKNIPVCQDAGDHCEWKETILNSEWEGFWGGCKWRQIKMKITFNYHFLELDN